METSDAAEAKPEPLGHSTKKKLIIVVLVFILVGTLVGAYIYFNPLPTHYSMLKPYKNNQAEEGGRYSFEYPEQMNVTAETDSLTVLSHTANSREAVTSTVNATNSYVSEEITSKLKEDLKSNRAQFVDEMKERVKSLPNLATAKDTEIKESKNLHISQENAVLLEYDYSYKGADNKKANIHGAELVIIGKERVYIMDISASGETWDKNQAIWSQVLNSYKVDQ